MFKCIAYLVLMILLLPGLSEGAIPQDTAATPQDAVATPQDAAATPQDAAASPKDAAREQRIAAVRATKIMERFDSDGNGTYEKTENVNAWKRLEYLDANKDDVLTMEELKKIGLTKPETP